MNVNNTWLKTGAASVNRLNSSPTKAKASDNETFKSAIINTRDNSRVDKIEISHCPKTETFDIKNLKAKMEGEIRTPTSPARLNALAEQIAKGEYSVDSNELAKIILKI